MRLLVRLHNSPRNTHAGTRTRRHDLPEVPCCRGKSCRTDAYLVKCVLPDDTVGVQYLRRGNDEPYSSEMTVSQMQKWVADLHAGTAKEFS